MKRETHKLFLAIVASLIAYYCINRFIVELRLYQYCLIEAITGLGLWLTGSIAARISKNA